MKIYRHCTAQSLAQNSVVTIGNFDGMHKGHQALLQRVKAVAAEQQLQSVVIVFEPQPREYFSADNAPPRVMALRDKYAYLESFGIDTVVCLSFSNVARLPAETFVKTCLLKALKTTHIVVGHDFRFGHQRQGDIALLQQYGITVDNIAALCEHTTRVSSTAVRAALAQDNFQQAKALLGHDWTISGRVMKGQQLGRKLGAPTLNLRLKHPRLPTTGIFAVRVTHADQQYWGVASLGGRPVLHDETPILEVHLLAFNAMIYSEMVSVAFIAKVRDIQDFSTLDLLAAQIQQDIQTVKQEYCHEQ